jgi:hypothetical protein
MATKLINMQEIIIDYGLEGKIQRIDILVEGEYFKIPWNASSKTIEWELIPNSEKKELALAQWESSAKDKDLAEGLRDRPDLALQPILSISIPQQLSPDWRGFNLSALSNQAYNRISKQTADQRSVSRFEGLLMIYSNNPDNPNYDALKMLWDVIADGLVLKPTVVEIATINQTCTTHHMKFSISSDGRMVLAP